MKIAYTRDFKKSLQGLPRNIQVLYKKQEVLFGKNWKDSRLHIKALTGNQATFSFRITRNYRALFLFVEKDMAIFYDIGHRRDIYE